MSAPEPPRKVFGGAQSGRGGAVLDYDRERPPPRPRKPGATPRGGRSKGSRGGGGGRGRGRRAAYTIETPEASSSLAPWQASLGQSYDAALPEGSNDGGNGSVPSPLASASYASVIEVNVPQGGGGNRQLQQQQQHQGDEVSGWQASLFTSYAPAVPESNDAPPPRPPRPPSLSEHQKPGHRHNQAGAAPNSGWAASLTTSYAPALGNDGFGGCSGEGVNANASPPPPRPSSSKPAVAEPLVASSHSSTSPRPETLDFNNDTQLYTPPADSGPAQAPFPPPMADYEVPVDMLTFSRLNTGDAATMLREHNRHLGSQGSNHSSNAGSKQHHSNHDAELYNPHPDDMPPEISGIEYASPMVDDDDNRGRFGGVGGFGRGNINGADINFSDDEDNGTYEPFDNSRGSSSGGGDGGGHDDHEPGMYGRPVASGNNTSSSSGSVSVSRIAGRASANFGSGAHRQSYPLARNGGGAQSFRESRRNEPAHEAYGAPVATGSGVRNRQQQRGQSLPSPEQETYGAPVVAGSGGQQQQHRGRSLPSPEQETYGAPVVAGSGGRGRGRAAAGSAQRKMSSDPEPDTYSGFAQASNRRGTASSTTSNGFAGGARGGSDSRMHIRESWLHVRDPLVPFGKPEVHEVFEEAGMDDGRFLVRTVLGKPDNYILSVVYRGKPTHHQITTDGVGRLILNKATWKGSRTIEQLVESLGYTQPGWPVALDKPVMVARNAAAVERNAERATSDGYRSLSTSNRNTPGAIAAAIRSQGVGMNGGGGGDGYSGNDRDRYVEDEGDEGQQTYSYLNKHMASTTPPTGHGSAGLGPGRGGRFSSVGKKQQDPPPWMQQRRRASAKFGSNAGSSSGSEALYMGFAKSQGGVGSGQGDRCGFPVEDRGGGRFLVRADLKFPGDYILSVVYEGRPTHHAVLMNKKTGKLEINKTPIGGARSIEEIVEVLGPKGAQRIGWPAPLVHAVESTYSPTPWLFVRNGSTPFTSTDVAARFEKEGMVDGMFLVRTVVDAPDMYVISVVYLGEPTHHTVTTNDYGKLVVNGHAYGDSRCIEALVAALSTPAAAAEEGWLVPLNKPIISGRAAAGQTAASPIWLHDPHLPQEQVDAKLLAMDANEITLCTARGSGPGGFCAAHACPSTSTKCLSAKQERYKKCAVCTVAGQRPDLVDMPGVRELVEADHLNLVEKDRMIRDVPKLQNALEAMLDEAVYTFVDRGHFRKPNSDREQATGSYGQTRVSERAVLSEWRVCDQTGKPIKQKGTLEELRRLLKKAKLIATGVLTQTPLIAIERVYKEAVDEVEFDGTTGSSGYTVFARWIAQGLVDKACGCGEPGSPEVIAALQQPTPSVFVGAEKTFKTSISQLDYEDQMLMSKFLDFAEAGKFGIISEEDNNDLHATVHALATSLNGSRAGGGNTVMYMDYIVARSHITKRTFDRWIEEVIEEVVCEEGIPLVNVVTAEVKPVSRAAFKATVYEHHPRPKMSHVKDWVRLSVAAHSLSALVRSYFAIKSECEAAYSKVELVTVKVRLARQTHDIVVVVRFEGMLCECQLRLAALLRLKDLTHIPTAVLRLPDENSPVPKMPIFIKPDDGDGGWNFAEELNADSFELIISYKRI